MRWFGIILILTMLGATPAKAQIIEDSETVVVLADDSLALPLAELAKTYTLQRKTTVNITLGNGAEQVEQVLAGAACDLFITAQASAFATLRREGVVDVYSQRSITKNRLVLIGAKDQLPPVTFKEQGKMAEWLVQNVPGLLIMLPDPSRAEGLAATDALGRMGLLLPLNRYIKTTLGKNALLKAAEQKNIYSIALKTDTDALPQTRKIAVMDTVPQEYHRPLRYEAVVVGGENMTAARKFLDYLTTKQAQDVFKKYGFEN